MYNKSKVVRFSAGTRLCPALFNFLFLCDFGKFMHLKAVHSVYCNTEKLDESWKKVGRKLDRYVKEFAV